MLYGNEQHDHVTYCSVRVCGAHAAHVCMHTITVFREGDTFVLLSRPSVTTEVYERTRYIALRVLFTSQYVYDTYITGTAYRREVINTTGVRTSVPGIV